MAETSVKDKLPGKKPISGRIQEPPNNVLSWLQHMGHSIEVPKKHIIITHTCNDFNRGKELSLVLVKFGRRGGGEREFSGTA